MATVFTTSELRPRKRHPFAPRHDWDRNFFLGYVGIIWLGILAGFVPEIVRHTASGAPAFPLIVHVHGVVFVSWLVLLTTQVLLIRSRNVRLHRKLGIAGAWFIPVMVIVGLATSFTIDKLQLHSADADPAFLSIQLFDMLNFGALAVAAVSARRMPSAHKRLILLATLSIADAGFARWLGSSLHFGDGVWASDVELFLPTDLLILGIGAYDWLTRRRLHPAWVLGAALVLSGHLTASWLYHSATWNALATSAIRQWPWT